jgi:hypothetical protein
MDIRINDDVIAVRSIGGVARPFVPAGTRGQVVATGLAATKVRFVLDSVWSGRREIEIEVYPGEVVAVRR